MGMFLLFSHTSFSDVPPINKFYIKTEDEFKIKTEDGFDFLLENSALNSEEN